MSSGFRTLLPHELRYGNTAFLSNDMSRRKESFGELLLKSPWWVSVVLGVFTFAGLSWGLRAWWGDNKVFQPFETVAANFAPFVALIFGMMAGLSFWLGKRRERLVDQQTSLESLRVVSWKDFEFLVAEAYRRQGYEVDFSLGKGAGSARATALRRSVPLRKFHGLLGYLETFAYHIYSQWLKF
jgi:restriction system protein